MGADGVDDDREEAVEQRDDLGGRPARGQLGRADQVNEQRGDLALLAAERRRAVEGLTGDVGPHMATEQVVEPLTLLEAAGHAVEAALDSPTSLPSFTETSTSSSPASMRPMALRRASRGSPTERATSTVATRPMLSAAPLSTSTLVATRSLGPSIAAWRPTKPIPSRGTPVASSQASRSRPWTPGPQSRGGDSAASARAVSGRMIRSVNR